MYAMKTIYICTHSKGIKYSASILNISNGPPIRGVCNDLWHYSHHVLDCSL